MKNKFYFMKKSTKKGFKNLGKASLIPFQIFWIIITLPITLIMFPDYERGDY
jgi:hypothetical protein